MQDYNFDEKVNRRHTNSYKWDNTSEGVIPMWVADMDFKTAPCIIDALRKRVDHGVFGYTKVPEAYYEAIVSWFERRHGWRINSAHLLYTTAVVPAVSAIIKALTRPGNNVIVQTPAYNCFYSSIRNNGCQLAANMLTYHADGSYTIDFDNLEVVASDANTKLMLLCNPHNPAGRVWSEDELRRIAQICRDNDVIVLSDEIHCELTYEGTEYHPFAPIAEAEGVSYVVACSPSKAFNTAGLQIANIIAPEETMRNKIDRALNDNEVCDVNPFGVVGLMAAYNEGETWLDTLRSYLWENYQTARNYLEEHLPEVVVTPLEGTYLMWLNCSFTGMRSDALSEYLEKEGGVKLSPGTIYGPGGEEFLRLNIACPRTRLVEGLARLVKALSALR